MKPLLPLAVLALTACSPSGDETAEKQSAAAPSVAEINAQPVVAPSGPAQLTPLAASAVAKAGCRFAYQSRTILAADPVREGVAVIDGEQVTLTRARPGAQGVQLTGGGYTFAIRLAGGGDNAATLAVIGPRGETTFAPGTWSCAS